MATVVLGYGGSAVGAYFGGPVGAQIGGLIGATVGAYIDGQYVIPALFGSDGPKVGRTALNGLSIQNRDEGTPVNFCVGSRVRVEGTLIWADTIREVKRNRSSGGKGGGGGAQASVYSYFRSVAVALCEGPVSKIVRIYADSKIIYDRGVTDARIAQVRLYTGTDAQGADAYLQSKMGSANTPAYRGTCYFVLEDLALRDFGNRLPNFTAIVEADEEMTLADAVAKIMDHCEYDPSEYDVSELNACFDGIKIPGPQSGIEMLEPLLLFHDVIVSDQNSTLKFTHRVLTEATEIGEDDLGTHSGREERVVALDITDAANPSIPSEVIVTFVDRSREFQPGAVADSLRSFDIKNVQELKVPITMHNGQARALARRVLYSSAAERQEVSLVLPPKYLDLCEGDVVTMTVNGIDWRIRVKSVAIGANKLIRVTGVTEQIHTYEYPDFEEDVNNFLPGSYTPPEVDFEVFDGPPMNTSQLNEPGFFFGISPVDSEATFLGGAIFISPDDVEYTAVEAVSTASTFGRCISKLKGPTDKTATGWALWDEETTFRVQIYSGSLDSATDDDILAGANRLIVGKEVVAFRTATLDSTLSNGIKRYTLSGFLRGRRGTQSQMYSHGSKDPVLLLDSDVAFGKLDLTDRNVKRYFKGVPVGADAADIDEITKRLDFVNLRPFSPVNLVLYRASPPGNDHVFTWQRRTRVPFNLLSGNIAPVGEGSETYTLEFLVGATVKRVVIVANSSTYTLSSADRSTYGVLMPYILRVYQMSSAYGRGDFAEIKVLQ